MSTYAWPTARWSVPARAELRVIDNTQRYSESPLSGYVQTLAMPGARWGWAYDMPAHSPSDRAQLEGFLHKLNGRQHRVQLWDHKRAKPAGTINLSGVQSSSSAAQFATTLVLKNCGASATLLAGDWLGLNTGQLLRCVADAAANGSGVMTVEISPMLRTSIGANTAVTLDKPTALYVRSEASLAVPRAPGLFQPAMSFEFMEVFA